MNSSAILTAKTMPLHCPPNLPYNQMLKYPPNSCEQVLAIPESHHYYIEVEHYPHCYIQIWKPLGLKTVDIWLVIACFRHLAVNIEPHRHSYDDIEEPRALPGYEATEG